ncbi:MAG: hypothetical protein A2Y10_02685 [Planctomycetes bacterium GWF2_41_51]|nr:MAG: hypothetical protein A2Y10_02685 [Planctomycetes bacterium GWF2_41_51]HBG27456.1 hypothetical protein [Phycisphaerales bacterium]
MAAINGKLQKAKPNRKKIAIIAAVIAVIVLSASGGMYLMFKGGEETDEFGRRRREWNDANMPNPDKQNAKQIIDYRNSERYKRLSQREQMMYTMASGRKLIDYHIDTYITLPKEQQTPYLDKLIDEMQSMRGNFEQMRSERPRRDANDPNMQRRRERAQQAQGGRRVDGSRMRAMRERGTPEQRAQRRQFGEAMQKRAQERGIEMPRFGGPGGPDGRGGR